jgi:tellurium resistance protein TerD
MEKKMISLTKGGNISLTKTAKTALSEITVGLGWSPADDDNTDFDLDASVFLVNQDGFCPEQNDFVFYNSPTSEDGSVVHQGDNLTGEGEGDDETVAVNLTKVDPKIEKIIFVVSIHNAVNRGQNFGQVEDAFMRIINSADGQELARFDLTEDYPSEIAIVFGELYRKNGDWKFKAVGKGYLNGLEDVASKFGIRIG